MRPRISQPDWAHVPTPGYQPSLIKCFHHYLLHGTFSPSRPLLRYCLAISTHSCPAMRLERYIFYGYNFAYYVKSTTIKNCIGLNQNYLFTTSSILLQSRIYSTRCKILKLNCTVSHRPPRLIVVR